MKNLFKKFVSVLLVTIMLLSTAPASEIAKIDFLSIFDTIAYAVNKTFKLGNEFGDIEIVSTKRSNQKAEKTLSTQADDVYANLTVGDTVDLYIHVYKEDQDGNQVEADVGEFPEVNWSAYPDSSVELTVGSPDTRNCSIKVISDSSPTILITASMSGQKKTFTINISSLTFDKSQYFILVDDTKAVTDLGEDVYTDCYAIWTPKEEGLSPEGYRFISSDESILKIDETGYYSKSFFDNRYNIYPSVQGVSEGEVTLTIKTPDGQTASCSVRVVGMKEYLVEVYSEDLDTLLTDSPITYTVKRFGSMQTKADDNTEIVKTNNEGIATVCIPDVKYAPNTVLKISSDLHPEVSIKAEAFSEESINRATLKLNFDMSAPLTNAQTVEALSVNIADQIVSLMQFETSLDFGPITAEGSLDYEEKKVKISIGVSSGYEVNDGNDKTGKMNLEKNLYKDENFLDYKNFYKGLCNPKQAKDSYKAIVKKLNTKEHKGSIGVECELVAIGYVELDLSTGKLKFAEGGISFIASSGIEKKIYTNIPAVYIAFGISGELSAGFSLTKTAAGGFDVNGEVAFSISPSAGVGVGCDLAKLEIGLEGELKFTINLSTSQQSLSLKDLLKITAKIDAYLEYKVDVWIIEWGDKFTLNLAEFEIFPNPSAQFFWQSAAVSDMSFTLDDRDYLDDVLATSSSVGEFSLSNVYSNGMPQIVSLNNNTKIAVWLNDDGKKNSVNRTTLVYSVFNGSSWSQMKSVCETGRGDYSPVLCTDGNNAYILWKRGNKVFDETVSFEEYLQNMELVYSSFNGEEWSSTRVVGTNNGKYPLYYSIAAHNSDITISWTENSENNCYLSSGRTTIYKQNCTNGIWSNPSSVTSTDNYVNSISSGYLNNTPSVAYSIDQDGDFSTADYKVYIDSKPITNDNNTSNIAVSFSNGRYYWIQDGFLCSYDGSSIKKSNLTISSNYRVVENGSKTAVVYPEADGFFSELYVSYLYKEFEFTVPVQLTNYGNKIGDYDVLLNEDNTLTVALDLKYLSDSKPKAYAAADFIIDTFDNVVDAECGSAWYRLEKNTEETDFTFGATVINRGRTELKGYIINLKDANGITVKSGAYSTNLQPGECEDIELEYSAPSSYDLKSFILEVQVNGDENADNNSSSFDFRQADIEVSNCQVSDSGLLSAVVKNVGYIDAENVDVDILKFEDGYQAVSKLRINQIKAGESKEIKYQFDRDAISVESYIVSKSFKVLATIDANELNYINNEKVALVSPIRVTSIQLDKSQITMLPDSNALLTAMIFPLNAVTKTVYWFSDNPDVASVDKNGNITSHNVGTATIKAVSSDGRHEAYCTVTVSQTIPVNDVYLSKTQAELLVGGSIQLYAHVLPDNATNQKVTWSSSKTSVATVSSAGLVIAKSAGTAAITAKTVDGGYTATCFVTVTKESIPVAGISIYPTTLSLSEGEIFQLTATVLPADATNKNVTWSSSKNDIAMVSSTGLITAKSPGETVISAKTMDGGYIAVCKVTVAAAPTAKTPVSISIASMPNKTTYIYKIDKFDKTGMSITVNYSDGSKDVITETSQFTVSAIQPKKGKQLLEVNYQGLKTDVDITVKYAWWQRIIKIILFGWIWY